MVKTRQGSARIRSPSVRSPGSHSLFANGVPFNYALKDDPSSYVSSVALHPKRLEFRGSSFGLERFLKDSLHATFAMKEKPGRLGRKDRGLTNSRLAGADARPDMLRAALDEAPLRLSPRFCNSWFTRTSSRLKKTL